MLTIDDVRTIPLFSMLPASELEPRVMRVELRQYYAVAATAPEIAAKLGAVVIEGANHDLNSVDTAVDFWPLQPRYLNPLRSRVSASHSRESAAQDGAS
jgi:hypothetical protein